MKNNTWMCRSAAIGLMASLGAIAAHAQSNVQIYGILDSGVEHLSGGGTSVTRMPTVTGGFMASRLGFRGTEDLGGGLKANFVMEMGLGADTGALQQSGRGFGRQSYVGLSGDWGSLTLGRQYTMGLYAMIGSDLMGPAVFGLGSLDAHLPNTRLDNAIIYRGKFGNFDVGAGYSTGRDSMAPSNCGGEDGTSSCDAYTAMIKYDNKQWGVALAYDRMKGKAGSSYFGLPSVAGPITSAGHDDHVYLTGFAMLGQTRLGAGMIHRELTGAANGTYKSDQYYVAVSHPVTPNVVVDATYTYLNAKQKDADAQLLAVRGSYLLSKRTKVYALVGHARNQSGVGYSVSGGTAAPVSPGLGNNQTGVMVGVTHTF